MYYRSNGSGGCGVLAILFLLFAFITPMFFNVLIYFLPVILIVWLIWVVIRSIFFSRKANNRKSQSNDDAYRTYDDNTKQNTDTTANNASKNAPIDVEFKVLDDDDSEQNS